MRLTPAFHLHRMSLIVDFLRWIWQRAHPDSGSGAGDVSDGGDRSSMADFVRILQTHDHDPDGPS
jgi:hypothetical protein